MVLSLRILFFQVFHAAACILLRLYFISGIELKFPYLPVIHCGRASRMDYFPMELLRLSDKAHRVKKRLTPFQLAKLIRVSRCFRPLFSLITLEFEIFFLNK